MAAAFFPEQVMHVFKIFQGAALVRSKGNGLHIFLNGTVHDLLHRAVMAQVDDFHARSLYDAPHDVDGSIVAVEQGGRRDHPDMVYRFINLCLCCFLHGYCG